MYQKLEIMQQVSTEHPIAAYELHTVYFAAHFTWRPKGRERVKFSLPLRKRDGKNKQTDYTCHALNSIDTKRKKKNKKKAKGMPDKMYCQPCYVTSDECKWFPSVSYYIHVTSNEYTWLQFVSCYIHAVSDKETMNCYLCSVSSDARDDTPGTTVLTPRRSSFIFGHENCPNRFMCLLR